MQVNTLKDLEAVIALCRRKGVRAIEISGIKLELGEAPVRKPKAGASTDSIESDKPLTDEELMFWSSDGLNG